MKGARRECGGGGGRGSRNMKRLEEGTSILCLPFRRPAEEEEEEAGEEEERLVAEVAAAERLPGLRN